MRWGRVYFLPSVTVSHGWDDNVEHLNDEDPNIEPFASGIGDIQPQLRFEMLFRKSLTRLVYRGDFRTYTAEILKNAGGMSHFLDFQSHLEFSRRWRLEFAARYADTITSMLNSAPGGEYQYGTQPVTTEEARLAVGLRLGATQSLETGISRATSVFQTSPTSAVFTDYGLQDMFVRYVLDSGPQNQFYLQLLRQDVIQGEESLLQPDRYQINSVGAGFRRDTGRDLTSELRVAYTVTHFTEGLVTPFEGFTLEGDFNLAPSPRTALHFKLRRAPLISFFNVSAYYLNEGGTLEINRALGRALGIRLTADANWNTYSDPILVTLPAPGGDLDQNQNGLIDAYENLLPSEGDVREDRVVTTSLALLWHVSRAMDFVTTYQRQQFDSNVIASGTDGKNYHPYGYESHAFLLSVSVGWR